MTNGFGELQPLLRLKRTKQQQQQQQDHYYYYYFSSGKRTIEEDDDDHDEEDDILHPKDDDILLPRQELQLYRIENMAVPACYLAVGIVQGLVGPLLNVYPIDLGATEAAQMTLSTVVILPATFKIMYGFLSDSLPIRGARRKPYMLLGWLLVSATMVSLWMTSNLSMDYQYDEEEHNILEENKEGSNSYGNHLYHKPIPPSFAPSIESLMGSFLLLGVGLWMADVMGDSLVAEKARLEPEHLKGNLQSSCYACRFFGMMVGAPLSTYLYSSYGPQSIVMTLVIVPVTLVPLILLLRDDKPVRTQTVQDRMNDIWTTVKSRAVWQPMAFVFLFNCLQVPNGAFRQFQKTVLQFTEAQMNYLLVVSYALLYLGTLIYKHFFLRTSWRRVYEVCIILNGIFSAMQLLLITGNTFGLSPLLFALGDDAFAEFIRGIQFLPCTIMLVNLCPEGSEGASYALFTTFNNSALLLAPAISTTLLGIWDVSTPALESGNVSGMFKLSILTTILQMTPLLILSWLPQSSKELDDLNHRPYSGSVLGGTVFLSVAGFSMLYIFVVAALNILCPGWAGESR